ncbi:MAG: hypothetical protein WEA99_00255 [Brumimicrobium sp.]
MKKVFGVLIFGIGLITVGCKEENIETQKTEDQIVHNSVDLTLNDDSEEIVQIPFDNDLKFKFFITNLKDHNSNNNWDESNTDTLAACLQTNYVEILDNSEHGYLDALRKDFVIGQNSGNWAQRFEPNNYVLSTSFGVGEFKGSGDKYLGFRLEKGSGYIYGWFLVNCSEKSDHLEIKEYAYNKTAGNSIKAGQE